MVIYFDNNTSITVSETYEQVFAAIVAAQTQNVTWITLTRVTEITPETGDPYDVEDTVCVLFPNIVMIAPPTPTA